MRMFAKEAGVKISGLVQVLRNLHDPEIGGCILKLRSPGYFLRIDGRDPWDLKASNGFEAVHNPAWIRKLTRSEIEKYQDYNSIPVGIGACSSYSNLKEGFIAGNLGDAKTKWLYGLYSKAVYLPEVRIKLLGGQTSARDYEKEHLMLGHVPLDSILFASSPEDREVFDAGLEVINRFAEIDPEVPASISKADVQDLSSILGWLLTHNSDKKAAELCGYVFKSCPDSAISHRLNHDKALVSAAISLRDETSHKSLSR